MSFVNPNLVYTDFTTGISTRVDGTVVETPFPNKFEGYEYKLGHNYYKGEDVSKGGYVYSKPGIYGRAVTLDIASMHPHSIIALQLFGEKTKLYADIMQARLDIKHEELGLAKELFDGKLIPYLDENGFRTVAAGLKTPINSVYGLTSAGYPNVFRDPRNVNNIVALRGALFMCMLKNEVLEKGGTVIHIKTDSIKLADPSDELLDYCRNRAKEYGYEFEVESTWDRICLIDKAQILGHQAADSPDKPGEWTAVGAKFQNPFIFKKLCSHEPINIRDFSMMKSVKSPAAIYIRQDPDKEEGERYIGKNGVFVAVKKDCPNNGYLIRVDSVSERVGFVAGTKDQRFAELRDLQTVDDPMSMVALDYYGDILEDAKKTIAQFGDVDAFLNLKKESDIPF